jgi:glycosyltransferase involved in cell wall biosynthesis
VVAQDSPGARWLLEDQATYVEAADEAAITAALDAAASLSGPEHLAARAVLARRRVWSSIAERYFEFLCEVHARLAEARA